MEDHNPTRFDKIKWSQINTILIIIMNAYIAIFGTRVAHIIPSEGHETTCPSTERQQK